MERTEMEIRYRKWGCGQPPQQTRLQVPGWGGELRKKENGSPPQPWYCLPFSEAATYGLEILYPFRTETHVVNENGKIGFEGDFSADPDFPRPTPPFEMFSDGFYGFTSCLDLLVPDGYCTRIEPHVRFFTDTTGTVPVAVPGHIRKVWAKIFFLVFKVPPPGTKHVFRYMEPHAQLIFVPELRPKYSVREMSDEEMANRAALESIVSDTQGKLAGHSWQDNHGNVFNDTYRRLVAAEDRGELPSYLKKCSAAKPGQNQFGFSLLGNTVVHHSVSPEAFAHPEGCPLSARDSNPANHSAPFDSACPYHQGKPRADQ